MTAFTGRGYFALELLLFACLIFHAANGTRLILAERGISLIQTEPLVRIGAVVCVIVGAAAAWVACGG